jgi:DNA-binding PadR family transcriptional regulator
MMIIKNTILGMLALKPLTGYDIRKAMLELPFLYWTANTYQIYKTLAELSDDAFVKSESVHQEGSPFKKVYTITGEGFKELHRKSSELKDCADIRSPFLAKLAWSGLLTRKELLDVIDDYEAQLKGSLAIGAKKSKRLVSPPEGSRDSALWSLIDNRIEQMHQSELDWIIEVKEAVASFEDMPLGMAPSTAERSFCAMPMDCCVVEKNSVKYLKLEPHGGQIEREEDGLAIVSLCVENGVNAVLIPSERLSNDFFRLSTKVAGHVLQKLVNYRIKTAAVIDASALKGKFKEYLEEASSGNMFHAYDNYVDAEEWLTS